MASRRPRRHRRRHRDHHLNANGILLPHFPPLSPTNPIPCAAAATGTDGRQAVHLSRHSLPACPTQKERHLRLPRRRQPGSRCTDGRATCTPTGRFVGPQPAPTLGTARGACWVPTSGGVRSIRGANVERGCSVGRRDPSQYKNQHTHGHAFMRPRPSTHPTKRDNQRQQQRRPTRLRRHVPSRRGHPPGAVSRSHRRESPRHCWRHRRHADGGCAAAGVGRSHHLCGSSPTVYQRQRGRLHGCATPCLASPSIVMQTSQGRGSPPAATGATHRE